MDLELNQPSRKIIEIGISIGELETRKILETKSFLVNAHETLNHEIITLTGINQGMVNRAPCLMTAYCNMQEYIKPFGIHRQGIEWGDDDFFTLMQQLDVDGFSYDWAFGRTTMNVKALVQSVLYSKGINAQGGLKKSCNRFNVKFEGPAHRADKDALNTLKLYFKLLDLFKELPYQNT
jgi:inhibitor of KinA sporulation pathway (predicted exonuclease)